MVHVFLLYQYGRQSCTVSNKALMKSRLLCDRLINMLQCRICITCYICKTSLLGVIRCSLLRAVQNWAQK